MQNTNPIFPKFLAAISQVVVSSLTLMVLNYDPSTSDAQVLASYFHVIINYVPKFEMEAINTFEFSGAEKHYNYSYIFIQMTGLNKFIAINLLMEVMQIVLFV